MAKYIAVTSQYNPFTLEELSKQAELATQAYNTAAESYGGLQAKVASFDNLKNSPLESDRELYQTVVAPYETEVQKLGNAITTGNLAGYKGNFYNISGKYASELAPIDMAITKRNSWAKKMQETQAAGKNIVYDINPGSVSLTDIMNGTVQGPRGINLDDVFNTTWKTGSPYGKMLMQSTTRDKFGNLYYIDRQRTGFTPADINTAIYDPEHADPIIANIVNQVKTQYGLSTVQDPQSLGQLSSTIANALNSLLGTTTEKISPNEISMYATKLAMKDQYGTGTGSGRRGAGNNGGDAGFGSIFTSSREYYPIKDASGRQLSASDVRKLYSPIDSHADAISQDALMSGMNLQQILNGGTATSGETSKAFKHALETGIISPDDYNKALTDPEEFKSLALDILSQANMRGGAVYTFGPDAETRMLESLGQYSNGRMQKVTRTGSKAVKDKDIAEIIKAYQDGGGRITGALRDGKVRVYLNSTGDEYLIDPDNDLSNRYGQDLEHISQAATEKYNEGVAAEKNGDIKKANELKGLSVSLWNQASQIYQSDLTGMLRGTELTDTQLANLLKDQDIL